MWSLPSCQDIFSHDFKQNFIWDAFTDPKVWCGALLFHFALGPASSYATFSPTLANNLGYTAAEAQLISVPHYILAAITTVGAGWYSDRVENRGFVYAGCALVSATGERYFPSRKAGTRCRGGHSYG